MSNKKDELSALIARAEELSLELKDELAEDAAYRRSVVAKTYALARKLQTPVNRVRDIDLTVFYLPAVVTALNAGWFRALHEAGDDGATIDVIAASSKGDPSLTRRFMRFLASIGVVEEVGGDKFASTAVSSLLCTSPGLAGCMTYSLDIYAPVSAKMAEYFANNAYQSPPNIEYGLCSHALGVPFWSFLDKQPSTAKAFNKYMETARFAKRSWVDVYPIQELSSACAHEIMLIDVAGGQGHELAELAKKKQALKLNGRLVLQERPVVVEQIPQDWRDMFEPQIHDIFDEQPPWCRHAKAYYMRYIMHDWGDEQCIRILRNLRDAMKPGYSKLLINDLVLPDLGCSYHAAGLDMVMLAGFSGKERTMSEWQHLFDAVGGVKIERIVQLEDSGESVIELSRS